MTAAREVAEAAAHEAVRETFRLLGVDIDDQASVNAFRADLVYARKLRRMGDRAGTAAFRAIVTVAITAAAAWLIAAIWNAPDP